MAVVHQVPLSMGFSRQEYWSGLPCPSPGELPNAGTEYTTLCPLHWQEGSLPLMLPVPQCPAEFSTQEPECQQKHPKKSLLNPSKLTGQLSLFSCSAVSDSLRPHGLQHARLSVLQYLLELAQTHVCWVRDASQPSHSLSPPSPLAPQSSTASGSFLVSQLFASDGQSTGASAPVLSMNIQDWFPLGLTGLISLQSNGFSSLLQHHS